MASAPPRQLGWSGLAGFIPEVAGVVESAHAPKAGGVGGSVSAMADSDPRYPRSSVEDDFNYGSCVASASLHIRMGTRPGLSRRPGRPRQPPGGGLGPQGERPPGQGSGKSAGPLGFEGRPFWPPGRGSEQGAAAGAGRKELLSAGLGCEPAPGAGGGSEPEPCCCDLVFFGVERGRGKCQQLKLAPFYGKKGYFFPVKISLLFDHCDVHLNGVTSLVVLGLGGVNAFLGSACVLCWILSLAREGTLSILFTIFSLQDLELKIGLSIIEAAAGKGSFEGQLTYFPGARML